MGDELARPKPGPLHEVVLVELGPKRRLDPAPRPWYHFDRGLLGICASQRAEKHSHSLEDYWKPNTDHLFFSCGKCGLRLKLGRFNSQIPLLCHSRLSFPKLLFLYLHVRGLLEEPINNHETLAGSEESTKLDRWS